MGRPPSRPTRRGLHPRWVTFFLTFLTFSFALGLVVVFGVNVPFVLSEGTFGAVRVRVGPPGPDFLLQTSLLVLLMPVLALEAIPLALPIHVLAFSLLYTVALERQHRLGTAARLLILAGLAFALTAPFPGLYAYPNPFPSLITLFPQILIPVVLFFGRQGVRFGFPLVAYALPILALVFSRPLPPQPPGRKRLSALPAYLLPSFMFGSLLLIVGGTDRLKVVGLVLTWSLMVAALLVWTLYYRPHLPSLRVPREASRFERRLYAWRRPAFAFLSLTILLILLTGLPAVDAFAESNALGHHGQHVALFLVGLLLGGIVLQQARAYRRARGLPGEFARFLYTSNVLYNPQGAVGAVFAVTALAFWHVPTFWDAALRDDVIHVTEHFFVIAAGSAVAFSLPRLPAGAKYALFIGATLAMSVLALTLWFTSLPIYATYPVEQLATLGRVHFLAGMPLMIYAIGVTATVVLRTAKGPSRPPGET